MHAETPALPAAARGTMIAGFERTLAQTSAALAKTPDSVQLYSERGDSHLFLGHFKEAVADFEKMIALDPGKDASHWRLGIAYYFSAEFAKSARQFAKYHAYDGRDRENGIWKFLAQAKIDGIEKALREMLPYARFDREPFPILYEMFAGNKTGEEVLADTERKGLKGNTLVQFFAHYYVGLNEELLGRRESAQTHLREAVRLFSEPDISGGPGYMWQVARLHYEALVNSK